VKIGDLVRLKDTPHLGIITNVEKDYYGAGQAFKVSKSERGKCIQPNMVDILALIGAGIRDRVLVLVIWTNEEGAPSELQYTYEDSSELEVISENR